MAGHDLAELLPLLRASHESLQAMVALHDDAELDDPALPVDARHGARRVRAGVRRQPLRVGPRHDRGRPRAFRVTLEPRATCAARGIPWFVLAGVLVAALSMRGPIVAPTPVLRDIEQDFGIGSATAGLLTTAPVLMFALLTPLAALVIRRAGAELALMLSLSGVLLGTVIRAIPGFGWMLAGMLVIGAAVTIGNVVIPVIIRRDVPPARVGVVTAAYVATLNAGSLVTSLATAPLAAVIGWPAALLRGRCSPSPGSCCGACTCAAADGRARSGAIATRGTSGSPRAARGPAATWTRRP